MEHFNQLLPHTTSENDSAHAGAGWGGPWRLPAHGSAISNSDSALGSGPFQMSQANSKMFIPSERSPVFLHYEASKMKLKSQDQKYVQDAMNLCNRKDLAIYEAQKQATQATQE